MAVATDMSALQTRGRTDIGAPPFGQYLNEPLKEKTTVAPQPGAGMTTFAFDCHIRNGQRETAVATLPRFTRVAVCNVSPWSNSAVIGIRPGRQLSGDKPTRRVAALSATECRSTVVAAHLLCWGMYCRVASVIGVTDNVEPAQHRREQDRGEVIGHSAAAVGKRGSTQRNDNVDSMPSPAREYVVAMPKPTTLPRRPRIARRGDWRLV